METMPVKQENNVITMASSSPLEAMMAALQNGTDLEKLEKMLQLQQAWEATQAKKAYVQAMADFKANPPQILKDKKVKFSTQKGTTEYSHATLANVTATINAALARHGLTASWKTEQGQAGITVTCTITHKLGHSESTALTAGKEQSGTKNDIQAMGSTITYLQRYTLLSLTGLATHDQDDDGRGSETVYINEKQLSTIYDMMAHTETNEDQFRAYLGISDIEKMPVNVFGKAMAALKAKEAKRANS